MRNCVLRQRHLELDFRQLLRRLADLAQERQPTRVEVHLFEKVVRHDFAKAGVAVLDRLVEPFEGRVRLGVPAEGQLSLLGSIRQRGGKRVDAFALEGDFDVRSLRSNTFEIEWPLRSGRKETFPEIDRAAWMDVPLARVKINEGQLPLLDRLEALLADKRPID